MKNLIQTNLNERFMKNIIKEKSIIKNTYLSNHICLLNPSISTSNIGDDIIVESCTKVLAEMFPDNQLISIPTQDVIGKQSRNLLKNSKANIILGTNILSSNLLKYRQLRWKFIDLIRKYSLITMGVGWWQYQDNVDLPSRIIYRRLLNKSCLLSTRDNYTKKMLEAIGFSNVINTGCPTMWDIPRNINYTPKNYFEKSVLTFTDYNKSFKEDISILRKAYSISKEVFFFPQAPTDLSYLKSLVNSTDLPLPKIINATTFSLKKFFEDENCCYVGTRLHAGLFAARFKIPCLIIAIDNRVKEIFDDCKLDYLVRKDKNFINEIENKFPKVLKPNLDFDAINNWKHNIYQYVNKRV